MLPTFALGPLATVAWLPYTVPALQRLLRYASCAALRQEPIVHAKINGKQVDVPTGTTIIEAARNLGIQVKPRAPPRVWLVSHD